MSPKLVVVDGLSLLFRAFYAMPDLRTSTGQPTGAVRGFLNMLLRLWQEEQPDGIVVAFDPSGPTFRHEQYEAYKANRDGAPEDLLVQIPMLKQALDVLGVHRLEVPGYEADDVLGTLAERAGAAGYNTLLVTGDRDALQLISDTTTVLLTRRGITEVQRLDRDALAAEFNLRPEQVIDLKGLMGDSSDNIPGVPGVGEKTAMKLLQQFGSLDEVLARPEEAGGKKLPQTLVQYREQALLSRELATIRRDAPLSVDIADLHLRPPDVEAAARFFTELEFRSLLERIPGLAEAAAEVTRAELKLAVTPYSDAAAWAEAVGAWREHGVAIGSAVAGDGYVVAAAPLVTAAADGNAPDEVAVAVLDCPDQAAWFAALRAAAGAAGPLAAHRAKPMLTAALRAAEQPATFWLDTELAAYLLDSNRAQYRLGNLLREYGLPDLPAASDPAGEAAGDAAAVAVLARRLQQQLQDDGLWPLYEELEHPLQSVLAGMEAAGIQVDPAALRAMSEELATRLAALEEQIHSLAGEPFNINSTKQLAYILFEKLGLPPQKKTKTGYSTDAEVLEALAAEHEIAARITDHRTLAKLKSTYVDGLSQLVDPQDGRVHTTFQQTVAATGRLSSTDPGLQNIPVRLEEGRRIRKVFGAAPGHVLLTADYSQIELRVLAHMAGDEAMLEAFRTGEDIHRRTAAEIFGLPLEDVTADVRNAAKAVNFGIVYGISDYGLARNIGITRAEAKTYIDGYFARYPGVRQYMDNTIAQAREQGYVTTLLGRRRYIPDIASRNFNLRSNAERMAINTPIQGTAADIIKRAMLAIDAALQQGAVNARMLLQVHDELIFEVAESDVLSLAAIVRECMAGAVKLDVPLEVETKSGPNWYDLKVI